MSEARWEKCPVETSGGIWRTSDLPAGVVAGVVETVLDLCSRHAFSREVPPRIRGAHYLAPRLSRALDPVLRAASAVVGAPLSILRSALLGATVNRTLKSLHGDADPWHLDAQELTLVIALSDHGSDYTGGSLTFFRQDPARLWELRRMGQGVPEDAVLDCRLERVGDAVLFFGSQLAHRVAPARAISEIGRLTLALALEVSEAPRSDAADQQRIAELLAHLVTATEDLVQHARDDRELPDSWAGELLTLLGGGLIRHGADDRSPTR